MSDLILGGHELTPEQTLERCEQAIRNNTEVNRQGWHRARIHAGDCFDVFSTLNNDRSNWHYSLKFAIRNLEARGYHVGAFFEDNGPGCDWGVEITWLSSQVQS